MSRKMSRKALVTIAVLLAAATAMAAGPTVPGPLRIVSQFVLSVA